MSLIANETSAEINAQPSVWERAVAHGAAGLFPAPGARVLAIGCGTSAFVARSLAALREARGAGFTDWAYASELPVGRSYDSVLAITRSGTTTEIRQALEHPTLRGARRTCVTAVPDTEVPAACDDVIDLSYADERSIVQTRFPTTVLSYARAALGEDLTRLVADGRRATEDDLPVDIARFEHFVFLGRGWTVGLADEAALKIRECAQAWSESYPALDYRHGPISVAGPRSLVVSLGGVGADLLAEVAAVGATVVDLPLDPLARLAVCQRLAVAAAEHRGLDVDRPRNLSRSVILTPVEEL